MTKIFVLGLDGTTWRIIDKLLAKNELPTFSKLIEHGVRGNLASSIPPATFPGWKCYSTGKNPGKIGIYGFLSMDFNNAKANINCSYSAKSLEIWDYLSIFNIKVGIINMPTTYPPKPVNGFMISHSLLEDKNFTFPKYLEKELKSKFNYRIMPRILAKVDKDKAIKECFDVTKIRFDVLKYLYRKFNPDFIHMTIFETDHLQHYFWKYIDTSSKYKDIIFNFYKFIDELLSETLKILPKDVTIFIMSDHGFTKGKASFNIGRFLLQKGLVKLKFTYNVLSALGKIGLNRENINKILTSTGLSNIITRLLPKHLLAKIYSLVPNQQGTVGVEGLNLDKFIDWNRSKIIFIERERYYINKRIIKENTPEYRALLLILKKLLSSIKEPNTKKPLFKKVLTKYEAYHGPYLESAPDVVVILNDGFIDAQNYSSTNLWEYNLTEWSGVHDYEGIFIAYGPEIKKNYRRDVEIYDLAPTILHMFGLPIPQDMDGKVLLDIFRDNSPLAKNPRYVNPNYYNKLRIKTLIKQKIRYRIKT